MDALPLQQALSTRPPVLAAAASLVFAADSLLEAADACCSVCALWPTPSAHNAKRSPIISPVTPERAGGTVLGLRRHGFDHWQCDMDERKT